MFSYATILLRKRGNVGCSTLMVFFLFFFIYFYYDQEQGVPQGGVLSTTLFSIKINDIVKCLGNLTDCSLYVDDFCICYRSKSMATIERQLQQN